MSLSDHSSISYDKEDLIHAPTGSHKVKYTGDNWDFHLDIAHKPVDLSLVLPHYRARNQPIEHRISMFLGNESYPMKLKVCRNYYHAKFEMEVRASTSDITLWLPSDFKGVIHCPKNTTFSAGFINRIMSNVRLNDRDAQHVFDEDEVIVSTCGRVTLRMWDVQTSMPENPSKETFKRLFCCSRKAPETTSHDWDFLLED
ncbi:hypothetical protein MSAN_01268200 [Mycena sanguinolenta]|uniref:Uncharacterized protein n=1 Tax=Mycena sanguinolenta TaxID=230812 RepID=A0A8H7D246_9AGAR|nr:hypothetical protein MSAN_01268200 [Mycena sanguinolenta]